MATYLPFPVPQQTFWDSLGAVAAGGEVQTFLAGTSTPVATFSDGFGTSMGTSFTLDSLGKPPAGGWYLDQSISYKVKVFDSSANLIYTQDNVRSAQDGSDQIDFNLQRGRSTITGTVNDYDLDAIITSDQTEISWWQWNGAAELTLTGLIGGIDGRVIRGQNITNSFVMIIEEEGPGSAPANRFSTNSLGTLMVNPGELFTLAYDGTAQRWDVQVVASTRPAAGATGLVSAPSGLVYQSLTPVGNIGAGEDDLISFALTNNLLSADGQRLLVQFNGTTAANANAKTLKVKYGASTLLDTGAQSINAACAWRVDVTIIRLTATTQRCSVAFWLSPTATPGPANANAILQVNNATAAETLTGVVTLKMTGEATSNADIINTDAHVVWQTV